jgi:hypothetical protein
MEKSINAIVDMGTISSAIQLIPTTGKGIDGGEEFHTPYVSPIYGYRNPICSDILDTIDHA